MCRKILEPSKENVDPNALQFNKWGVYFQLLCWKRWFKKENSMCMEILEPLKGNVDPNVLPIQQMRSLFSASVVKEMIQERQFKTITCKVVEWKQQSWCDLDTRCSWWEWS